ncbi:hypothetical protein HELRODRAFT_158524 [Helobdella robusta]|uniref:Uncharacterized protein n=1 Tax=Helobdella robusta TaxID=6412 RepID=T1EMW7_HELRO|nr:hypothetical protein HELRODRAFT_158524 [Helobdella robusta]ESO12099.1 hypothetical protein HELRODRAFT_158524 [Helobdella robusta]
MIDSANSWWEQRNFSDVALSALGTHPVVSEIKKRMIHNIPHLPNLNGFSEIDKDSIFSCSSSNIKMLQFGSDGSIIKLNFNNTNVADGNHKLGVFVYKTFDEKDFNDFGLIYNYNNDWSAGFYKPNITISANPESKLWKTFVSNLYINKALLNEFCIPMGLDIRFELRT